MNGLGNIQWSHRVRSLFEEHPIYFWSRYSPYVPRKFLAGIEQITKAQKLAGVKADEIFGAFHTIVRANLHPNNEAALRRSLIEVLKPDDFQEFVVRRIVLKSYGCEADDRDELRGDVPTKQRDLLSTLDEDQIRTVQEGGNDELFGKLIDAGLLVPKRASESSFIRFYLAIRLREATEDQVGIVADNLAQHLLDTAVINYPAVYTGIGFCSILVKGEVPCANYFSIGDLGGWLRTSQVAFHPETITYLVGRPTSFISTDGDIGFATLRERRGRHPLAQQLLPELYESGSPNVIDIHNLFAEQKELRLSPTSRKVLRGYFLACLDNSSEAMALPVISMFRTLEDFLRTNCGRFLAVQSFDFVSACRSKQIVIDKGMRISLGDLLSLYSIALKDDANANVRQLANNWEEVVRLRNRLMHGDEIDDWKATARVLFLQLPRFDSLLEFVRAALARPLKDTEGE